MAVGNGDAQTRTINLDAFDTVEFSGVSDLVYVQTKGEFRVEITIDSNLMEYIEVEQNGDQLTIDTSLFVNIIPTVQDVITVYAPELLALELSGTGDFTAAGISADSRDLVILNSGTGDCSIETLAADSLVFTSSGTGGVSLNNVLLSGRLNYTSSGTGSATVTGSASTLSLTKSGTGDFDGRELAVSTANVTCSGTGSAYIRTSGGISGTLSGTGNLYCYGNGISWVLDTGTGSVIRR